MNKIADYMSTQIFSTSPDQFAYIAIDGMYLNKISCLLVKEADEYVGIFTKMDWMLLVLKGECDPKVIKVSGLMTKITSTIDMNQTIAAASVIIEERKIRHIPVTKEDKIVGMFSVKDLEKYYLSLHKKTDF